MTRAELVDFLRHRSLAVEATNSVGRAPQTAVVGFVVTDALELFFDTVSSSRKYQNLKRDPRVAFAIGWDAESTVQLEGVADEPTGDDLARLQAIYFDRFKDGLTRRSWPGIVYIRVRPTWARFSDFGLTPPKIVELDRAELYPEVP
jgi:general stress protein 26